MIGKQKRHGIPLFGVVEAFDAPRETNRKELTEAARVLRIAIDTELTQRQRTCLLLYHEEHLTMQQIADQTGLTRGTVCKHIQKATDRLYRAMRYSSLGARWQNHAVSR